MILTVAVPWLVLTTTGSATLAATAVFAGVGGAAIGGWPRAGSSTPSAPCAPAP